MVADLLIVLCYIADCTTLHHTATHCNTLHTLQHTATHCNTLCHIATHIQILQRHEAITMMADPQIMLRVHRSYAMMLQFYGARCVLQCVAVCSSVLQCVAVCCSVLQCIAVYCSVLQCVAVCCSALQCIAVHCSALQCVAVCCIVLVPMMLQFYGTPKKFKISHCNTLQHTATRCNTLQHTATSEW